MILPPPRGRSASHAVRWAFSVLLLALFFTSGLWLSQRYNLRIALEPAPWVVGEREGDRYRPAYTRQEGPHLVLAFVGSSRCHWSNVPELPAAIEELKLALARLADEQGLAFKAVGIAVDWMPEQGMEYLSRFGKFDEVSVGFKQSGIPATPKTAISSHVMGSTVSRTEFVGGNPRSGGAIRQQVLRHALELSRPHCARTGGPFGSRRGISV